MHEYKITALLTNWKRKENLNEVIDSIKKQSIPIDICLWNNNNDDNTKYDVNLQFNSEKNFKCWPRWFMGSLIESDFLFTLDDYLKFSDNKVIEDVLNFYLSLEHIKNLNPIVGYTGVILNKNLDYWKSTHIIEPDDTDIKTDIIKGRFMFMHKNIINEMTIENEPTCEDIKVSSVSNYKIIPHFLKERFVNLNEMGVGLFGSIDHEKKRNEAVKKYFKKMDIKEELINLDYLMNFYGSDKFGCGRFSCHNYTDIYKILFENIRFKKNNIFELGLGTNNVDITSNMGPLGSPGASLRAWRDYFPNSLIYGADIDINVLFSEDRIETFYCDQTKPIEVLKMWSHKLLIEKEFDVIIDDGLHEYHANMVFFENSIFKLKKGGYFIVEDLNPKTVEMFKENINLLKMKHIDLEFTLLGLHLESNSHDNNLLIIKKNN